MHRKYELILFFLIIFILFRSVHYTNTNLLLLLLFCCWSTLLGPHCQFGLWGEEEGRGDRKRGGDEGWEGGGCHG